MAFLVLLIVVGSWAYLALRDRPAAEYACLFFVCVLLAVPPEVTTLRLLQVYEWNMQLLADPEADMMLGSVIIAWLNPLLGLLYARYCRRGPILVAALAATALGLVETVLVNTGYMVYRVWSPLWTTALFFAYFLLVWRLTLVVTRIPLWVHICGFIMWISLLVDIPLQGIFWLWHFEVSLFGEPVRDNRIFSWLPNFGLLLPLAAMVSLAAERLRLLLAVTAISLIILIEAVGLARGFVVHHHWSLGWSAVKVAGIIAASVFYAGWARVNSLPLSGRLG